VDDNSRGIVELNVVDDNPVFGGIDRIYETRTLKTLSGIILREVLRKGRAPE